MGARLRIDWAAVKAHYEAGHTVRQCQEKFGFSAGAWHRAVQRGDVRPRPRWSGVRASLKRERIGQLRAKGMTYAAIARDLGISKPTVAYHARRLGLPADDRPARRYDWGEIQRAYDSGLTVRECAERFGFSLASWNDAVRRGAVRSRPRARPIETYLVIGRRTSRTHLKERLLSAGLKENRCERCGITEWMGEPFNMHLHHINGDGTDNRLVNLQMLCGNCHAQTDSYGGRNGHRRKRRKVEKEGAAG